MDDENEVVEDPSFEEIMEEAWAEEQQRIARLAAEPRHRLLIFRRHGETQDARGYVIAWWSKDVTQGRNCDLKTYHDMQGDEVDDWCSLDESPKESGFWIFDGEFIWEGGGGQEPEWEHKAYGIWRRPSLAEIVDGLQGQLRAKPRPIVDHAALAKPRVTTPSMHTIGDELGRRDRDYEMNIELGLHRFKTPCPTDDATWVWTAEVTMTDGTITVHQTLSEDELRRRAHAMLDVADKVALRNAMKQPIDQIRFKGSR